MSGVIQTVTRATRHIITTTATTIGGLFPLILTSIFFQPLAWAMSVGVIGASLIALFYIPAMFMILKKYLELFNTLFRAVDISTFFNS